MMKSTRLTWLAALAGIATFPVHAQEGAGDKVNVVVVYGDDACPASTAEEIVVCPRLDEAERFRIPTLLRSNVQDNANQAWTQKVKAYEYVGKAGAMSCSPTGGGGFTGCTQSFIDQAYAEKANSPELQAGKMVAEEREKRLSHIDAESDEVEAQVKEIEQRQAAERAAKQPAAPSEPPVPDEPLPELRPN